MLIVAGHFLTAPGQRAAFLAAAAPMVAATREEAGCREYTFSPDPDDANRVMLYELWDDQAALDAHFATDHMASFQAALADVSVVDRDVQKYTISEVGSLP